MESLDFAAPVAADATRVRLLTQEAQASDLSFANIYLLQEKYSTTIALHGGFLFRHFAGHGRLSGYAFPCGRGDVAEALEWIKQDAARRHRAWVFCLLTQDQRHLLEQTYPGQFAYHCDPGDADYLYRCADLAELPGSAYHAKRNHIAQFERQYPDHRFCPLSATTAHDALTVAQEWLAASADPSPALLHETRAIERALQHAEQLRLFGGVLYVGSQAVAMALGSRISADVADIHYEKCLPDYRRAYPVINRAMARYLQGTCSLINREEDLNQPGLRQAKYSYHPCTVLHKYSATLLC